VHDDVVHLVGRRKYDDVVSGLVEQDVLYIFGLTETEVPASVLDGFSSCCNTQYNAASPLRILTVSTAQDRIIKTVVLGTTGLIAERYVSYNGDVVALNGTPIIFSA
jgi:hypothetical protein